ncbi:cysteate racemase [Brevibacterium zhoupengii]|uniref:aspartate/glutamate racemase family protein n=1 Tax=Brevibacterium zhoupengii TaxID=2898795 RepID=UPI001E3C2EB7|nr:amino acid racemase [Brevibacterium zhoupengii]
MYRPEPTVGGRTVGILGGMGPAATVDFYDKLVRATPATRDQEHLRVALWADPSVPDRSRAFDRTGADPTPWLSQGIDRLIGCGAEILVVPCNTIHIYMPAAVRGKDIEFISIIDAAVEAAVQAQTGHGGSIGLLATDAAIASGLYQRALKAAGLHPRLPSPDMQQLLMDIIYRIKAGCAEQHVRDDVETVLRHLGNGQPTVTIAACTEISVVLTHLECDLQIIDPSLALARKTVERAQAQTLTSIGEENR